VHVHLSLLPVLLRDVDNLLGQSEHRTEGLDHLSNYVVERKLPALSLREADHLVAQELPDAGRISDCQAFELDRIRWSSHGFPIA